MQLFRKNPTEEKFSLDKIYPTDEERHRIFDLIQSLGGNISSIKDLAYIEMLITCVKDLIEGKEEFSILSVNDNSLDALKYLVEYRSLLEKEELLKEKGRLIEEKIRLSKENEEKEKQVNNLNSTIRNQNQLMQELEREYLRKKEELELKLEEEIKDLTSQKNNLENAVKQLEFSYKSTALSIENLQNYEEEVEWIPIEEDDDIYFIELKIIRIGDGVFQYAIDEIKASFNDYLKKLMDEYQEKTGCTEEEVKNCFKVTLKLIKEIENILNTLVMSQWVGGYRRIENLHSMKVSVESDLSLKKESNMSYKRIYDLLKLIKVPKYKKVLANPIVAQFKESKIPTNLETLTMYLHFQKIALDAVARTKTLEAELRVVLELLRNVSPNNDFVSVLDSNLVLEDTTLIEALFNPNDYKLIKEKNN